MAKSKGRVTVNYSKQFNDFQIVPIRTVYKKKYKYWISSEKCNYVIESVDKVKTEFQLYKIRSDMHFLPCLRIKNAYLYNTIDSFTYNSSLQDCPLPFIERIRNSLKDIINNDVPFKLNGKIHLYHTYKILGFIRESYIAYELSNNELFINNTVAKFERANQSFKLNYKKYKKLHLKHKKNEKSLEVKTKTTYLFSAFIYRTLLNRGKYLNFFLSYFSMMGIDNLTMFANADEYESNVIEEALEFFMSGNVTKQDCADSLSCILYYYLHFIMRFSKSEALQYSKYIVQETYGEVNSYTGSELLKNIHVKEVIGSHIVFNFSTKTKFTTEHQKNYLEEKILTSMKDMSIDKDRFATEQIKSHIENPLKTYVLITPIELLEKY